MESPATDLANAFNVAINRADLADLTALMSEDHRFVDSAGSTVAGKEACVAAWASFFESFPDYRNVFDSVDLIAEGRVVATGRSESTVGALNGPARSYATISNGLISEWRVEDPDAPSRGLRAHSGLLVRLPERI